MEIKIKDSKNNIEERKSTLKSKNFLNNQNYVINEKIKLMYIMDFYLNGVNLIFPLNIIGYLMLNINRKNYYLYLKNNIFNVSPKYIGLIIIYSKIYVFNIILAIFTIYIYSYIGFYSILIYLLIVFYFNFKIIDIINDFFETNFYVIGFKKRSKSIYQYYGYKDNIYKKMILNDEVLINNGVNIHKFIITILNLGILIMILFILL